MAQVWANVQPVVRPCDVSWALSDTHCWRPFFGGKRGYPPPTSVPSLQVCLRLLLLLLLLLACSLHRPCRSAPQVERLSFRKTTDEHRSNIEREVEDRLQREFEELRGHRATDWNRSVGANLKKLLRRFEQARLPI